MEAITISTLPAEIHDSIAKHCEKRDLLNLCLTSKLLNARFLPVIYRHVELLDQHYLKKRPCRVSMTFNQDDFDEYCLMLRDRLEKQQLFFNALQSHPEYGRHVRSLKGKLYYPTSESCHSHGMYRKEFWRVMQSLTLVQSVDIAFEHVCDNTYTLMRPIPDDFVLFQSATSVRLMGNMHYLLAKAILDAINPATLKHLCLDMVRDSDVRTPPLYLSISHAGQPLANLMPGDSDEDGRIFALGAAAGLLKTLTGRCTALRTLELRRVGQTRYGFGWHVGAEEASYMEWANFIRSVQTTLEEFTFEQVGDWIGDLSYPGHGWYYDFTMMNERFRRLLFPTIVSESWSRLTSIALKGVSGSTRSTGDSASDFTESLAEAALATDLMATELRSVLGENVKIVMEGEPNLVGFLTSKTKTAKSKYHGCSTV